MEAYSKKFWGVILQKAAWVADFAPTLGRQIKIAIDQGNVESIRSRAKEGLEFAQAQVEMWDEILKVTEDGTLDLVEGASVLVKIEKVVDEGEDVVKNKDEDDTPPVE